MRLFFLLFFATALFAKETILLSILPQKYIAKQIVSNHFTIDTLIPPGASPATYSLKPSQLKSIKKACCYFTIGVPFEKAWIRRIKSANEKLRIVDMGKYIKRYPLAKSHKAKNLDPHIWLAPNLVIELARALLDEVIKIDPSHADEYLQNYQKFVKRVIAIDTQIYRLLLQRKSRAFLVYHPSFGYFARSYNLKQLAIEKEGKEPKIKELIKLAKKAKSLGIKTIFIEPQFPQKSARFLAKKIGATIKIIDPLAYEWEENIIKVARAIAGY